MTATKMHLSIMYKYKPHLPLLIVVSIIRWIPVVLHTEKLEDKGEETGLLTEKNIILKEEGKDFMADSGTSVT